MLPSAPGAPCKLPKVRLTRSIWLISVSNAFLAPNRMGEASAGAAKKKK